MNTLTKKMFRDLWHLRAQVLAIALVVTCGVSVFVMSLSTFESLSETRARYYREQKFGEVFFSLKRAPNYLIESLKNMEGVKQAQTRIVADVRVTVDNYPDPIIGRLVSLPDNKHQGLNRPYLQAGRWVEKGNPNEILLSEAFAKAHGLRLGDTLELVIKGHKVRMNIVGIALSPEYIYQIAPGAIFPDFKRYAILWMDRDPLENAYEMEGAFNDLSVTLFYGANVEEVIRLIDKELSAYGGLGGYARKDQLSHRFLEEEFRQLKNMATMFPIIFFGVAAFLIHIVISRLISTQREQIAILKAFGIKAFNIGTHYVQLVLCILTIGILGGIGVGLWLGRGLSNLYMDFYRFPFLDYGFQTKTIFLATGICFAVGIFGALFALQQAVKLAPAEAMRPEAPEYYKASLLEKLALSRYLNPVTKMIYRNIERRPLKSLLSVLGISLACAVLMIGYFQEDSIDHMVKIQFSLTQREDLQIHFAEPTSVDALYSLQNIPGVIRAEGFRAVPVRIRHEQREYLTALQGILPETQLLRVIDADLKPVKLPPEGVVLTDYFSQVLKVKIGDVVTIETLEGAKKIKSLQVVGFTKQYLGLNAYMQMAPLNRLMEEGHAISGALLDIDSNQFADVYERLKEMPQVTSVTARKNALQNFYNTLAETILIFTFIVSILGGTLAFGVVYNTARIALAEKNRDLATLRIIGFKHIEVAQILFGELLLLTFVALPIGLSLGYGLCYLLSKGLRSDLYRVPLILAPHTYAYSVLVILIASMISCIFVWQNLKKMNYISALKIKE